MGSGPTKLDTSVPMCTGEPILSSDGEVHADQVCTESSIARSSHPTCSSDGAYQGTPTHGQDLLSQPGFTKNPLLARDDSGKNNPENTYTSSQRKHLESLAEQYSWQREGAQRVEDHESATLYLIEELRIAEALGKTERIEDLSEMLSHSSKRVSFDRAVDQTEELARRRFLTPENSKSLRAYVSFSSSEEGPQLTFTDALHKLSDSDKISILNETARIGMVEQYRQAASKEKDPTKRLYYESKASFLEGELVAAKLAMMEIKEKTRATKDPVLLYMREDTQNTLRNLSLAAIDELVGIKDEIANHQKGKWGGKKLNENRSKRQGEFLSQLRLVIEEGKADTIDEAVSYLDVEERKSGVRGYKFFGIDGYWTNIGAAAPIFKMFFDLETKKGLQELSNPWNKQRRFLEIAKQMRRVDIAPAMTNKILEGLFIGDLRKAGAEAGKGKDSIDTAKKAFAKLDEWYKSGRLDRDTAANKAWEAYKGINNPTGEWRLKDSQWIEIEKEIVIGVVTFPIAMGAGSAVRIGVGRIPSLVRFASQGKRYATAAKATIATSGIVTEAFTLSGSSSLIFGEPFSLKGVAFNMLKFGAFHGGGALWGNFARRMNIGEQAIATALGGAWARKAGVNFAGAIATQTAIATTFTYVDDIFLDTGSPKTFWTRLGGSAVSMVGFHFGGKAFHAATGKRLIKAEGQNQARIEVARKLNEHLTKEGISPKLAQKWAADAASKWREGKNIEDLLLTQDVSDLLSWNATEIRANPRVAEKIYKELVEKYKGSKEDPAYAKYLTKRLETWWKSGAGDIISESRLPVKVNDLLKWTAEDVRRNPEETARLYLTLMKEFHPDHYSRDATEFPEYVTKRLTEWYARHKGIFKGKSAPVVADRAQSPAAAKETPDVVEMARVPFASRDQVAQAFTQDPVLNPLKQLGVGVLRFVGVAPEGTAPFIPPPGKPAIPSSAAPAQAQPTASGGGIPPAGSDPQQVKGPQVRASEKAQGGNTPSSATTSSPPPDSADNIISDLHALIAGLSSSEIKKVSTTGEFDALLVRATKLLRSGELSAREIDQVESAFGKVGPRLVYEHVFQAYPREQIKALAEYIRILGARNVVEVGAGDGRLARALERILESCGIKVTAVDDGSFGIRTDSNVIPMEAMTYLEEVRGTEKDPDVIIFSWPPLENGTADRGPVDFQLAKLIRDNPGKTLILFMTQENTGSSEFYHNVLGKIHPTMDYLYLLDIIKANPAMENLPPVIHPPTPQKTMDLQVKEPLSLNYVIGADGHVYQLNRSRMKGGRGGDESYVLALRSPDNPLPDTEPLSIDYTPPEKYRADSPAVSEESRKTESASGTSEAPRVWTEESETKLVEASADLLIERQYHGALTSEQAQGIVRNNRQSGGRALYLGASFNVEDFLATGAAEAVFVSDDYTSKTLESTRHNLELTLKRYGISDLSFKEEGDPSTGGKWIWSFTYQGERKTIFCYGKKFEGLFREFSPGELEGGITHLISLHRTAYPAAVTMPMLASVRLGGYVENVFGTDAYLLETLLGLRLVAKGSEPNGYNIYQKVADVPVDGDSKYGWMWPVRVAEAGARVIEQIDDLLALRPYKEIDPNEDQSRGNVYRSKSFKVKEGEDPVTAELEHDFRQLTTDRFDGALAEFGEMYRNLSEKDQAKIRGYLRKRLVETKYTYSDPEAQKLHDRYRQELTEVLAEYLPDILGPDTPPSGGGIPPAGSEPRKVDSPQVRDKNSKAPVQGDATVEAVKPETMKEAQELLNMVSFGRDLRARAQAIDRALADHPVRLLNHYLRGELGEQPTLAEFEEIVEKHDKIGPRYIETMIRIVGEGESQQPIFQVYTREFLDAMAGYILKSAMAFEREHGRPPKIRELAAGDGRLTRMLNKRLRQHGYEVVATDLKPEKSDYGIRFTDDVLPMDGVDAAREGDILIGSWWPMENDMNDIEVLREVVADPKKSKTLILVGDQSGHFTGSPEFYDASRYGIGHDEDLIPVERTVPQELNYTSDGKSLMTSRLSLYDEKKGTNVAVLRAKRAEASTENRKAPIGTSEVAAPANQPSIPVKIPTRVPSEPVKAQPASTPPTITPETKAKKSGTNAGWFATFKRFVKHVVEDGNGGKSSGGNGGKTGAARRPDMRRMVRRMPRPARPIGRRHGHARLPIEEPSGLHQRGGVDTARDVVPRVEDSPSRRVEVAIPNDPRLLAPDVRVEYELMKTGVDNLPVVKNLNSNRRYLLAVLAQRNSGWAKDLVSQVNNAGPIRPDQFIQLLDDLNMLMSYGYRYQRFFEANGYDAHEKKGAFLSNDPAKVSGALAEIRSLATDAPWAAKQGYKVKSTSGKTDETTKAVFAGPKIKEALDALYHVAQDNYKNGRYTKEREDVGGELTRERFDKIVEQYMMISEYDGIYDAPNGDSSSRGWIVEVKHSYTKKVFGQAERLKDHVTSQLQILKQLAYAKAHGYELVIIKVFSKSRSGVDTAWWNMAETVAKKLGLWVKVEVRDPDTGKITHVKQMAGMPAQRLLPPIAPEAVQLNDDPFFAERKLAVSERITSWLHDIIKICESLNAMSVASSQDLIKIKEAKEKIYNVAVDLMDAYERYLKRSESVNADRVQDIFLELQMRLETLKDNLAIMTPNGVINALETIARGIRKLMPHRPDKDPINRPN